MRNIYIYEKKKQLQISPGLDVRDLLLLAAKTHLVLRNILKFVPVMFSISFLACVASGEKQHLGLEPRYSQRQI